MASQYRRRSLMLNTIAKVAQGNPTIINDSSSRRLKRLDIFGQSEQGENPSPDYPQEIISKEVSEIKLYGTNLFDLEKEKLSPNTNWNEERQCFYPKGVAYYIGMVINEAWDIAHESGNILTVSFDIKADKNGKVSVYVLGNRSIKSLQGTTDKFDVTQKYTRKSVKWLTIDKRGQPETSGQGDNCGLSLYGVVDGESVIPEVKNICISITENTEYIPFESQTITLPEPITLYGVPVTSGGNVTIDGQQYISDVITEKDGVIGIERNCYPKEFKIADMNNAEDFPGWANIDDIYIFVEDGKTGPLNNRLLNITTNLNTVFYNEIKTDAYTNKILYLSKALFDNKTQTEIKESYPNLTVVFVFERVEPTFEPLPEEVQAQYKALKSYYPNTVIQTGCWNEVTYSAKRGG